MKPIIMIIIKINVQDRDEDKWLNATMLHSETHIFTSCFLDKLNLLNCLIYVHLQVTLNKLDPDVIVSMQ